MDPLGGGFSGRVVLGVEELVFALALLHELPELLQLRGFLLLSQTFTLSLEIGNENISWDFEQKE